MDIIEATDITFSYISEEETRTALDNVSMRIPKGQFVAVLGHNGSGKSTFAKHINALLVPQEGSMLVAGFNTQDEEHVWDIRKTAGMVFQNPDNQIVSTIVEEDVAFGPENLGVEPQQIKERVKESLAAVNMSGFEKRAPHMLSGGQKQRIAIAGVLAMHPDVIVFDEPTAMLDPMGRHEVLSTIHKLNKQGKTIVFITHYMEEASDADVVYLMNNGCITYSGTPQETFIQSQKLNEASLVAPFATQMYLALKERGIMLDSCPMTAAQLAEELSKKKDLLSFSNREFTDTEAEFGETIVELQNLNYSYGTGTPFEIHALKDVSLQIKKGEFIGIIGHTGCGKSTLIQQIAGLLKPDSGAILVCGSDINGDKYDRKTLRREVGVVFQYPEYQLFEETVAKDVAFGPTKAGYSEEKVAECVKAALELVGFEYEEIKDVSPFDLSGGQKRKVAIAGVLATKPKILILDEPIAGLDPIARENFMQLVQILNENGTTIIMISHNMDGLCDYASRVIAMEQGEIYMDGTPKEVFSNIEKLRAASLDASEARQTAYLLKQKGIEISQSITKPQELLDSITVKVC